MFRLLLWRRRCPSVLLCAHCFLLHCLRILAKRAQHHHMFSNHQQDLNTRKRIVCVQTWFPFHCAVNAMSNYIYVLLAVIVAEHLNIPNTTNERTKVGVILVFFLRRQLLRTVYRPRFFFFKRLVQETEKQNSSERKKWNNYLWWNCICAATSTSEQFRRLCYECVSFICIFFFFTSWLCVRRVRFSLCCVAALWVWAYHSIFDLTSHKDQ